MKLKKQKRSGKLRIYLLFDLCLVSLLLTSLAYAENLVSTGMMVPTACALILLAVTFTSIVILTNSPV